MAPQTTRVLLERRGREEDLLSLRAIFSHLWKARVEETKDKLTITAD